MEDQDLSSAEFLAAHAHSNVCFWYAQHSGDPRDVPKARFDLTLREALDLIRATSDLYFYDIDMGSGGAKIRLGTTRINSLLEVANQCRDW